MITHARVHTVMAQGCRPLFFDPRNNSHGLGPGRTHAKGCRAPSPSVATIGGASCCASSITPRRQHNLTAKLVEKVELVSARVRVQLLQLAVPPAHRTPPCPHLDLPTLLERNGDRVVERSPAVVVIAIAGQQHVRPIQIKFREPEKALTVRVLPCSTHRQLRHRGGRAERQCARP